MTLLPDALRATLPPLYATEGHHDPIVRCKFFTPWGTWSWFAIEFDGEDTFYGLVDGFEVELGYFSLSELESVSGQFGLMTERDLYFKPRPLSQVKRETYARR